MIRIGAALVLIGMSAILCACSSRYESARTEVRQPQPIHHDASAEVTVARPRRQAATITDATNPTHAAEVTGSIGRTGDIRPWPKRGTAEWDQLQAEELAREKRIKEVLNSICHAC